MPHVMPLRDSRARAERVFVMRAQDGEPWSRIRDELGFKSVGAAQLAYKRFLARNAMTDSKTAFVEIIERKRVITAAAFKGLAAAQAEGDLSMVAQFIGVISRNDAELAWLHGMGQQNVAVRAEVDVTVTGTPAAILEIAPRPSCWRSTRNGSGGLRPPLWHAEVISEETAG